MGGAEGVPEGERAEVARRADVGNVVRRDAEVVERRVERLLLLVCARCLYAGEKDVPLRAGAGVDGVEVPARDLGGEVCLRAGDGLRREGDLHEDRLSGLHVEVEHPARPLLARIARGELRARLHRVVERDRIVPVAPDPVGGLVVAGDGAIVGEVDLAHEDVRSETSSSDDAPLEVEEHVGGAAFRKGEAVERDMRCGGDLRCNARFGVRYGVVAGRRLLR